MGGWGWGMAMFGWLFMTALIVGVGWAIWSAGHRPGPPPRHTRSALELLDDRYARGDIARDEYLERNAGLEG